MPNIQDVARLVEVSPRTVSRVINDDPKVSPRTRKAVLKAIEEMGYVPNQAARSLRDSRTRTIGIVLFDLNNLALLQLLPGMEELVHQRGYSLLLCDSRSDPHVEGVNLRRLYERRVEGLILVATADSCPNLELFTKSGVPHIVMHTTSPYACPKGTQRVRIRPELGLQAALRYLVGLGHRRITVVSAPGFPHVPIDRGQGAESSLLDYPHFELILRSQDECAPAITSLLARPDRPTAIVTFVHAFAPYVLESTNASGIRIPEELSFIVMGGSAWVRATQPPLTTILFDYPRLGRLAAEYIFSRIDGDSGQGQLAEIQTLLIPRLMVRDSCASPAMTTVTVGPAE